jgi:hypothetical protein
MYDGRNLNIKEITNNIYEKLDELESEFFH